MRVIIDRKEFEGTPLEILELMRQDHFDADRFASAEEYMKELQQNAWRFFGKGVDPQGETLEEKAFSLLQQLHEIHFIQLLE